MSIYADQDDEWSPSVEIKPIAGSGPLGIDPANDLTPEGVVERQRRLAAFMAQPDPFDATDMGEETLDLRRVDEIRNPAGSAAPNRAQQEWIDFYDQTDPAMRSLLTRKTPETLQLLRWQAGLSKNKASMLQIRMVAAKITFSVSVVAFTNAGEFRVFVLPSEAADIQMEMGSPLSYTYEGKTCESVFVSCYRLDGFPYKFLQLGVDPEQEKE